MFINLELLTGGSTPQSFESLIHTLFEDNTVLINIVIHRWDQSVFLKEMSVKFSMELNNLIGNSKDPNILLCKIRLLFK